MRLTRADLEKLCDALTQKALHEQLERRKWQRRAQEAESRLAIYEPAE